MTRWGGTATLLAAIIAGSTVWGVPGQAAADPSDPVDGAITGGLIVAGFAIERFFSGRSEPWQSELFQFDDGTKENFSPAAKTASDFALLSAMLGPIGFEVGRGLDDSSARGALLYGEALAATYFLTNIAKAFVRRPRPYVYNPASGIREYTERQGDDAYRSFFSGHTSMAFASAVAGGYLYGRRSANISSRAALWGTEMFLATSAAMLRVKAGKHFPSDVLTGAIVGIGIGIAVPALHGDDGDYTPQPGEWAAIVLGAGVGLIASDLIPWSNDDTGLAIIPFVSSGQFGFAGTF